MGSCLSAVAMMGEETPYQQARRMLEMPRRYQGESQADWQARYHHHVREREHFLTQTARRAEQRSEQERYERYNRKHHYRQQQEQYARNRQQQLQDDYYYQQQMLQQRANGY
ncbi:hypothetical protein BDN72DRAFT_841562 [Pluteus cervinus]|uniref:Uncharacterized protein n=1 Tax=Pluteus cervinus TaxID=181527 RepID=A0ACD3ASH6_9AGAR|nr:hypothetical protein BDN72DRAFT_841562 [Pluteus cervinus]